MKTAPKTARSPITGAVIPLGAHPGNTGGKKGRSGRKPLAITLAAQKAVTENDLIAEAVKIATTAERDSDKLAAIRFLVERGWGPATEATEEGDTESHEGALELLA